MIVILLTSTTLKTKDMFAHAARRLGHTALLTASVARRSVPMASCQALSHPSSSIHNYPLISGVGSSHIYHTTRRERHSLPYNTVIVFVPHQEAWVVERMGKFHKILEPGVNLLLPIVDKVKYVQNLKEMAFEIVPQSAITADNVEISIDGVLYLKVIDAYKTSYHIDDPQFSVTQLAQTTMRSEIGKIQLDSVFRERESLNTIIVSAMNNATSPWGITCLRYEIRDIKIPSRVQDAMQLQVEAERKRRARILESEGTRDAEINVANGEATAIMARARAKADALTSVQNAIKPDAAAFLIAEQYVKAFSNLARTNNTLILPADAGDVNKMVAQAFQVYKTMSSPPATPGASGGGNGGTKDMRLESIVSESYMDELEDVIREKSQAIPTTNIKTKARGGGSKNQRQ